MNVSAIIFSGTLLFGLNCLAQNINIEPAIRTDLASSVSQLQKLLYQHGHATDNASLSDTQAAFEAFDSFHQKFQQTYAQFVATKQKFMDYNDMIKFNWEIKDKINTLEKKKKELEQEKQNLMLRKKKITS